MLSSVQRTRPSPIHSSIGLLLSCIGCCTPKALLLYMSLIRHMWATTSLHQPSIASLSLGCRNDVKRTTYTTKDAVRKVLTTFELDGILRISYICRQPNQSIVFFVSSSLTLLTLISPRVEWLSRKQYPLISNDHSNIHKVQEPFVSVCRLAARWSPPVPFYPWFYYHDCSKAISMFRV